jgi:hypothetical protein
LPLAPSFSQSKFYSFSFQSIYASQRKEYFLL